MLLPALTLAAVALYGHSHFGHGLALLGRLEHRPYEQKVEDGETDQRDEGEERLVGVDVAPLVGVGFPEARHAHRQRSRVRFRVCLAQRPVLEEFWEGQDGRRDADDDDDDARALWRAPHLA